MKQNKKTTDQKESAEKTRTGRLQKTIGDIPTNAIIIPMIALIAILHLSIIIIIFSMNSSSSRLSLSMQETEQENNDVNSLYNGATILVETSNNFILSPLTKTGSINYQPMVNYVDEYLLERRGADILDKFESKEISGTTREYLESAVKNSNKMIVAQLHAIALVHSIYPLPTENSTIAKLPLDILTEAEKKLTAAQREADARALIKGAEYTSAIEDFRSDVENCIESLHNDADGKEAQISSVISALKVAQWVMTLVIVVILALTFMIIYAWMIKPLNKFVTIIGKDGALDETRGLHEVRLVASSYNNLLDRREALEGLLRAAAETDALTNLSNRYGMEKYFLEAGKTGYSLAMVLFDVNYLKRTNDTLGHAAGDRLIQQAGECISKCFSGSGECTWYRFGGDEFAAAVKNTNIAAVEQMIEHFKADQKERGISVSWGYAYTTDIGSTTIKQLMDEADRKMYHQKQIMHLEDHEKSKKG